MLVGYAGVQSLTPGLSGHKPTKNYVACHICAMSTRTPAIAGMPYLLVLPHYWMTPQSTAEACRSSWGGGDEASAYAAATAVSTKKAGRVFDAIAATLRARPDFESAAALSEPDAKAIAALLSVGYEGQGATIVQQVYAAIRLSDDRRAERRTNVVASMAAIEWKPALDATCFWKKLGVWVGYPFNYEATTTLANADPADTGARAKRNVQTLGAVGVGFSPNVYFSILFGITVARVDREKTQTAPPVDGTLLAWTIAIGGNLDLVTPALKK